MVSPPLSEFAGAKLKKLEQESMRQISGQEGLNMILENFRVSGNQNIRLRQDDFSNPDKALFLEDFSLDDGSGNGVTIGSTGDPISFDVEGSDGGRWVIELPDNYWNIDPTAITFDNAYWQDNSSSFGEERRRIAEEISITEAQWAGGTRFALGTWPGGGLQAGIGMVLDGNILVDAPSYDSEMELYQIGGFANCSNGPANFDIDSDCSGVLNWASLEEDRPLVFEMYDDGGDGKLFVELNPNYSTGSAGQIVVEQARLNQHDNRPGANFGEIWTSDIIITNLEAKGPIDISTKGSFTGRTTGCTHNTNGSLHNCPSPQ
jgi:hypothetical protein